MTRKHALAVVLTIAASVVCAAGTETAAPPVQVAFVHPEKFTDIGPRPVGSDPVRGGFLGDLGDHLAKGAAARLPPDLSLSIAVTDVDLAGSNEPSERGMGSLRIVRDVHPPRIDLAFALVDRAGNVVKRGERRLRELDFRTASSALRSDPLRYEKAMIDRWLEREFPQ